MARTSSNTTTSFGWESDATFWRQATKVDVFVCFCLSRFRRFRRLVTWVASINVSVDICASISTCLPAQFGERTGFTVSVKLWNSSLDSATVKAICSGSWSKLNKIELKLVLTTSAIWNCYSAWSCMPFCVDIIYSSAAINWRRNSWFYGSPE